MADSTPRIYVASLSDYNAGRLVGEWIDADQDADDIHAAIQAMLATSKEEVAEEWAIHDYEGFGDLKLSEYESIERVAEIGQAIAEHGDAMAAFLGYDSSRDPSEFADAYLGHFDKLEDYAENLLDDMGVFDNVNDMLRTYFDVEQYARDLDMGGDVYTVDDPSGGVFVFDGHV